MRRALTAVAALSLASPALAVDYAQCEAMQKTVVRLRAQKKAAVKEQVWEPHWNELEAACPPSKNMAAWRQCGVEFEKEARPQREKQAAALSQEYDEKIAKVAADHDEAGCP